MRKANLLCRTIPKDRSLCELFTELSDVRFALSQAYTHFNNTVESELIDAAIYEISSLEAQYNYLLRLLKEQQADAVCTPLTEGVVTWS